MSVAGPCAVRNAQSAGRAKTSLIAQERDAWLRAYFQVTMTTVAAEDLVVVDETGSHLQLTPRMARALRGQRAYGAVPRNTPPTTTLLAALTTHGLGAALIIDGATDTPAFTLYVEQVLAPTLRAGQIVVLDNLSAHNSPDLSPIELAFAKLKAAWRRVGARTQEILIDAIAATLDSVTTAQARAFFRHCGSRLTSDWNHLISTLL
jgi:transposase